VARAKRHDIAGQVWHITHRCYKREILLRFAKDRRRWLQWLFEAKRRYRLAILDYVVTLSHIHLTAPLRSAVSPPVTRRVIRENRIKQMLLIAWTG